jgi:subfamily B ATP-binding cassette protein MsbA
VGLLVIRLGGHLSWALLLFIPVVVTSARKIGREVRTRTRTGQDKLAEIQNILHETVTGNRIVKAFNTELWEILRFKKAAPLVPRQSAQRAHSVDQFAVDGHHRLRGHRACSCLIGRNEIQHGRMTWGSLALSSSCCSSSTIRCASSPTFYNSFQQAMGASSSIFAFFDAKDDVKERPHAVTLKGFQQSVQFENVGFSYSTEEGEHQILHNVDLDVRAGEVLALVGPSGAGKSTLVNLIPRFFDVTSGRILIDGHDIRDLTLGSLRRQVAQVTQETILFNDTVRNNIAYGQPE